MKKKLQAELVSIAHRILQLKNPAEVKELVKETRQLYEKLAVLDFAESHYGTVEPTISQINTTLASLENKPSENKELLRLDSSSLAPEKSVPETSKEEIIEKPKDPFVAKEEKPELFIEKINEKVSEDLFVPAKKFTEENISLSEPDYVKNDKSDVGYEGESMPILNSNDGEKKQKSLNEQLKRGIQIGLNNRLAFIKHLFDGNADDYNRVLSQLNTLQSRSGAEQFIRNMVKPDYNQWKGKEKYEERFMQIISNRFEF